MFHDLNPNYFSVQRLNRSVGTLFFLILSSFFFFGMSFRTHAADQLILKDGKSLTGELRSLDSKEIVFKTAKGKKTYSRTQILQLTLQKKRTGHGITKAEELPDKWLVSQLKSFDRTQTSDSGIVVMRNKRTFILTAPGLWTEEQQLTLFVTKTPREVIQNAIDFQPDTESAEIDHVWYIDSQGAVSHLNEADGIRTRIKHKLSAQEVIGYQLTPPESNTIIDIKLVKTHLKANPYKTFHSLIQADQSATIEVISPAEKKWQIEHHINDDQKQIKYANEVRGKQLFQTWKIQPVKTPEAKVATLAITVKDRFSDEIIDGYSVLLNKSIGKTTVNPKRVPTVRKLASICHSFSSARTAPVFPVALSSQSKQDISRQIELKLAEQLITQLRGEGFVADLLLVRPNSKETYGKLFNVSWYDRPLVRCHLKQTYYLHPFFQSYYFPELDVEYQSRTALCMSGNAHGKVLQTPAKNFFNEQCNVELTVNEILADQSANVTATLEFNGRIGQTMSEMRHLPIDAQKKEMSKFLQRYYPGATLLKYTFQDAPPNHSKIKFEYIFPKFTIIADNQFLLCDFQSLPFAIDSELLPASYTATAYVKIPKGYQLHFLTENVVCKTPNFQLSLRFLDTATGYKATLKKTVDPTIATTAESQLKLKQSEGKIRHSFKTQVIMKPIK